jgi:hypothetical protein
MLTAAPFIQRSATTQPFELHNRMELHTLFFPS